MADIARCTTCDDSEGKAFRVPWDEIGVVLMKEHLREQHPEISLPGAP